MNDARLWGSVEVVDALAGSVLSGAGRCELGGLKRYLQSYNQIPAVKSK